VPLFAAKSLDISTSPTLSGRPRERGVAFNMQHDKRYDLFCKLKMFLILLGKNGCYWGKEMQENYMEGFVNVPR